MSEGKESLSNQPYILDVVETKYPYINVKQNLWSQPLTDFRRTISSVNPFALQQIPTHERIALGYRWGNAFFVPNYYPNHVQFKAMYPVHYNPLSEGHRATAGFQTQKFPPRAYGTVAMTADKLPRGCVREVQKFKRCSLVNGRELCDKEMKDILSVCPNWALDEMKEKKRFMLKVAAIQNNIYQRAMQTLSLIHI
eukprot:TRINITY_DN7225_c0_g1_i2.p1 TRINITY_DN7225_c0_g1~~TRINITY_DN7225_c0_g1_i2.p1  ORF type:complete len:196 (-),score=30.33 TRINITY_DN7225_c0_g1_i2:80-667(-)